MVKPELNYEYTAENIWPRAEAAVNTSIYNSVRNRILSITYRSQETPRDRFSLGAAGFRAQCKGFAI